MTQVGPAPRWSAGRFAAAVLLGAAAVGTFIGLVAFFALCDNDSDSCPAATPLRSSSCNFG